jgi:hypothetical protein
MVFSFKCTISTIAKNAFVGSKIGEVSEYFDKLGSFSPENGAFTIWAIIFIRLLFGSILHILDKIWKGFKVSKNCKKGVDNFEIIYCKSSDTNKKWLDEFTNSVKDNVITKRIDNTVENILLLKIYLFNLVHFLSKNEDQCGIYFYNYQLKTCKIYFTWVTLATLLNFNIYRLSMKTVDPQNFEENRKISIIKLIEGLNTLNEWKLFNQEELNFINGNKKIIDTFKELKILNEHDIKLEDFKLNNEYIDQDVIMWAALHLIKTLDLSKKDSNMVYKKQLQETVLNILDDNKKKEFIDHINDYENSNFNIPSIFNFLSLF